MNVPDLLGDAVNAAVILIGERAGVDNEQLLADLRRRVAKATVATLATATVWAAAARAPRPKESSGARP